MRREAGHEAARCAASTPVVQAKDRMGSPSVCVAVTVRVTSRPVSAACETTVFMTGGVPAGALLVVVTLATEELAPVPLAFAARARK